MKRKNIAERKSRPLKKERKELSEASDRPHLTSPQVYEGATNIINSMDMGRGLLLMLPFTTKENIKIINGMDTGSILSLMAA